ncbi:glucose-1-phosphate thymidylyltransferase [bacterium NHP-B]|nr:glucose-1-phosphate thymidylyltransferase [bacterium NHP-B]
MACTKGIILAGGSGSRLFPLTLASNKQLLPVYDKPVIYYPLTTLMLAGVRTILIIGRAQDMPFLQALLGTGEQWGLTLQYAVQDEPRGLPDAFLVGKAFLQHDPALLILGDNVFYGQGLSQTLIKVAHHVDGVHTFLYRVHDPRRYGVMVLDEEGRPQSIVEKPDNPPSKLAITGLYLFDGTAAMRAETLVPSARGELEIVDLIASYMTEGRAQATVLGRGYVWLDVGTPQALLEASEYVSVVQSRQSLVVASPEEVAWRMKFISSAAFQRLVEELPVSAYRSVLEEMMHDECTQNSH